MKVTLGQIRKIIREELNTPRRPRRRKALNEVAIHHVDEFDPAVDEDAGMGAPLLDIKPDRASYLDDSDLWMAVLEWVTEAPSKGNSLVLWADRDEGMLYCWFAKSLDDVLKRA